MSLIDLEKAREAFAQATDGTVGIEEEFAILDPQTLDLVPRFEELDAEAAAGDAALAHSISSELILSEIEIRSGAGSDLGDALARQSEFRQRLFSLAASQNVELGSTGTHPWADYREQLNVQSDHYRRVVDGLQYVARRNNTFSLHVHVGIRDADRAVRVCDRLRALLPTLLALSANSVFFEGQNSGLASVRTQSFTKSFPRCGVPDAYGSWDSYREYLELLLATGSIEEDTQVWWSVRPHLAFGTVEVRICDAQSTADESNALTELIVACVLQCARDDDDGRPIFEPAARLIEENLWRAIRWGAAGELIDLERGVCLPARAAFDQLLEWTAPVRAELGIEPQFPALNGAERQAVAFAEGQSIADVYASTVAQTRQSFGGDKPTSPTEVSTS
jgi:carboxylate-amine ligase